MENTIQKPIMEEELSDEELEMIRKKGIEEGIRRGRELEKKKSKELVHKLLIALKEIRPDLNVEEWMKEYDLFVAKNSTLNEHKCMMSDETNNKETSSESCKESPMKEEEERRKRISSEVFGEEEWPQQKKK